MLRLSFKQLSPPNIKSFGIIHQKKVDSVSKWPWDPFCTQFAELQYSPTLDLSRARHMEPAMQVFSELRIKHSDLVESTPKLPSYDEIENAMKSIGFSKLLRDSAAPSSSMREKLTQNRSHNVGYIRGVMLEKIEDVLQYLADAVREEAGLPSFNGPARKVVDERRVDYLAGSLLTFCGFRSPSFLVTSETKPFKIFGKKCNCKPDKQVLRNPSGDLVLIFEDKAVAASRSSRSHGHLGQILGELLHSMYLNGQREITHRSVFAVRLINYYMTCFRLDPSNDLDALFNTRKGPTRKLKLLCSVEDPLKDNGLSLIREDDRRKAMRLMANIRASCLNDN